MPEHAPSAPLGTAITPDPAKGPLLVAHLGGPKTGSSAIQAFCDHNRTALFRQHGILYPTLNPDAPWWPDRELTAQEVATMLMQCVHRQHARLT